MRKWLVPRQKFLLLKRSLLQRSRLTSRVLWTESSIPASNTRQKWHRFKILFPWWVVSLQNVCCRHLRWCQPRRRPLSVFSVPQISLQKGGIVCRLTCCSVRYSSVFLAATLVCRFFPPTIFGASPELLPFQPSCSDPCLTYFTRNYPLGCIYIYRL